MDYARVLLFVVGRCFLVGVASFFCGGVVVVVCVVVLRCEDACWILISIEWCCRLL